MAPFKLWAIVEALPTDVIGFLVRDQKGPVRNQDLGTGPGFFRVEKCSGTSPGGKAVCESHAE